MIGALRFLGIRTMQIVAYCAMILNFMGVQGGWLSVSILIVIGVIYAVVDYLWITPQEMSFTTRKNLELRRMFEEFKKI